MLSVIFKWSFSRKNGMAIIHFNTIRTILGVVSSRPTWIIILNIYIILSSIDEDARCFFSPYCFQAPVSELLRSFDTNLRVHTKLNFVYYLDWMFACPVFKGLFVLSTFSLLVALYLRVCLCNLSSIVLSTCSFHVCLCPFVVSLKLYILSTSWMSWLLVLSASCRLYLKLWNYLKAEAKTVSVFGSWVGNPEMNCSFLLKLIALYPLNLCCDRPGRAIRTNFDVLFSSSCGTTFD